MCLSRKISARKGGAIGAGSSGKGGKWSSQGRKDGAAAENGLKKKGVEESVPLKREEKENLRQPSSQEYGGRTRNVKGNGTKKRVGVKRSKVMHGRKTRRGRAEKRIIHPYDIGRGTVSSAALAPKNLEPLRE